jgi:hypothetical protein
MIYTFDIALLIRRYVSPKFRHPENLQAAYVLCSWMNRIQQEFMNWRTFRILEEYRFNGLVHSLERLLNNYYDPAQDRIYITVVDQVPVYYHLGDGQAPIVHYAGEGVLSGYYHLDDGAVSELYTHEFIVHIPMDITIVPKAIFSQLDLYRYAGRRPAIRVFDPSDVTVAFFTYPSNDPVANYL